MLTISVISRNIYGIFESNTVSQDACCMIVKYAGRQHMKGEFAIVVLDGVTISYLP